MFLVASAAFATPVAISSTEAAEIIKNPDTLGAYVRAYYSDTPILADIAWCESRMRQYDKDGNLFRGIVVKEDVGVMQINTHYHGEKAKELNLDLSTLSGNLAYAKYLYEKEGTKPWISSSPCWAKIAQK